MSRQSVQAGKAVIVVELVDRATASFKKMQSSIMGASRSFRDIGTNTAGAALLTGVPIAKGLQNYARFTNEIQNIEAKLGNFGNASQKVKQNSLELRDEIIKLGRDTAYTSIEVAKAAGVLAQGGLEEFGAGTIKASLKSIIDLGRGTALALEDSANMAVSLATTFKLVKEGMKGNEVSAAMTQIADQIVKAGRLSIAGADDMGASLVYVSQAAADLKATVPEVLTLLNQLAQAGIKGSVAGTSLNTAFANLLNNAKKIRTQFPDFTNVLKPDGNINLIETFGKLGGLMKKMSTEAKLVFLADVFNLRGARAASAIEDIEGMRKGLQQITNSAGEASQSAQVMMAGFGGALERLGGAIDKVNIQIGIKFDKALKGSFEIITLFIDKIGELSVKHTLLLGAILLSPIAFAGMAVGALTLSFILARLSVVIGLLVKGFKGLKSVGGVMLGGAKSLGSPIAAYMKTTAIKKAAIVSQTAKLAKLQTALDISYAKASAKKVGSVAAIAKINASKKAVSLLEGSINLRNLQGGGTFSRGRAAIGGVENFSKAINQKIRTIALVVAERKQIKAQVAAERLLSEVQRKRNLLALSTEADPAKRAGIFVKNASEAARSSARLARAGQALKSASLGKAIFSGVNFTKTFATMGRGISIVAQLAFSFAKLTATLTRFVFSWNFVGLVLNILLLFGDKIPAVRKAFTDLGAGIGAAFSEIGKIAEYAAPAFKLFSLAITAFSTGNTAIGIGALSAGFSGIVAIIQNQLTAAWDAFAGKVADLWISIKQVGLSIFTVFNSIIGSITAMVTSLTERLFRGLSGAEVGGKSSNMFEQIALGLDSFITNFGMLIITLNEYLLKFLDGVQIVFGKIISAIPGTGTSGADISEQGRVNSAITDVTSMFQRSMLRVDAELRAKALQKAFTEVPKDNKDNVNKANAASESIAETNRLDYERLLFEWDTIIRNSTIEAQNAGKAPFQQNQENADGGLPPAVEQFVSKLDALVGSLGETRNLFKIEEKTTIRELQTQTLLLQGIKDEIKTQGAIGH